jgi:hypothetical protein
MHASTSAGARVRRSLRKVLGTVTLTASLVLVGPSSLTALVTAYIDAALRP